MPSRTFTRRLVDQMIWAIDHIYKDHKNQIDLVFQLFVYIFIKIDSAGSLEMNWQILFSKYVFSNKELQNNTVKTAGLGDRIQAKHTQKNPS